MLVMNEIRDERGVSVDNKIKDGKRGGGGIGFIVE